MKNHKSFDEQVKHIVDKKNIQVSSKVDTKTIFKLFNYINVISPYKIYFYTDLDSDFNHEYLDVIEFEKYLIYYTEDKEISKFLQSLCCELETYFTTSLIYVLSECISNNLNYLNERGSLIKNELIIKIKANEKFSIEEKNQAIEMITNNKLLKDKWKVEDQYYIPYTSWVYFIKAIKSTDSFDVYTSIFTLALSTKTSLYNILKNNDQKKIINLCSIPSVNNIPSMRSYLKDLRETRNRVSHFENLTIVIDRQFKDFVNRELKRGISIDELNKYSVNKNYIFRLLKIADKYFSSNDFNEVSELLCMDKSKIKIYQDKLYTRFNIRKQKMLTFHSKYFKINI